MVVYLLLPVPEPMQGTCNGVDTVLCLMCRCIIDRKERQFDAESCRLLCNFAEVVVREIQKEDAKVPLT